MDERLSMLTLFLIEAVTNANNAEKRKKQEENLWIKL